MHRDLLYRVPLEARQLYAQIQDEMSSFLTTNSFYSDRSSFFALIRPLLGKLFLPAVGREGSFFFSKPNGVIPTTDDIDERVAARAIWAAVFLIQSLLNDMLTEFVRHRNKTKVQYHARTIWNAFEHLEIYIMFVRFVCLGRRPSYLLIECIFASAQGLHCLVAHEIYGIEAVSPSWYIDSATVDFILFESVRLNILPNQRLQLPFDIESSETQWLIAQIPSVISNVAPPTRDIQANREARLRNDLSSIIGTVWPSHLNPPAIAGPTTPVAGASTTKRNISSIALDDLDCAPLSKRPKSKKDHRAHSSSHSDVPTLPPLEPALVQLGASNGIFPSANTERWNGPINPFLIERSGSRLVHDPPELISMLDSVYAISSDTATGILVSRSKLSVLQRSYYNAARGGADVLMARLSGDICDELRVIRRLCPEPFSFLHTLVAIHPGAGMELRYWEYLVLTMNWHPQPAFESEDQFSHFIQCHTQPAGAPTAVHSLGSFSSVSEYLESLAVDSKS